MDSRDELMELMQRTGIPVTRENYIDLNWGDDAPEWTSEMEAELPRELQDWTLFEQRGDALVPASKSHALVEKSDKPKSEFQSDRFKNGVFVAAHVNHDSAIKIFEYAKKLKLPKESKLIEPVDYHATLIYSEQPFDYQHDIQSSVYPVKVKSHKTLKVLGTALVLAFVSALLQRRHDELKDQGGKHSFSEYKPHVTIAEVPTDTSLKQLGDYKGPIEFSSESARPIEAPKKKKEETTVSLWPLKEEDYETFMDRCVAAFLPCLGEEAGTEVCDGKWDASEKLGRKGFVTKAEVGEENARSPCGESCLACNEAPLDMRRDWDESKHPREPAGGPGGGQFAGGDSGGGQKDTRGDWSFEKEPGLNKDNMNTRSLQEAVDRGAFEMKLGRVRSGSGSETQEVHIKPNDIPAHWSAAEKGSGRRSYYDPKLAEAYKLYEGDPGWSTKPKDTSIGSFDVKSEPGRIYRGMSYEEYQNALRDGHFESKGGFNLGEAQRGLTYFSTDPQQASSYANGFAPWMYKATPSRPAVIVEVDDPGNHVDVPGLGRTSTEVGIRGKVPTSSVRRVWLGKPHIIDEGEFDLIRDKYRGTSIGGGASYSASVHWEEEKAAKKKWDGFQYPRVPDLMRDWDESQHPRGQPDNPGQFGPGGGGTTETTPSPAPSAQEQEQGSSAQPSVHQALTLDETAALGAYQTDDIFTELNDELRTGAKPTRPEMVRQLDSVINKHAVAQEMMVYRGMNYGIAQEVEAKWGKQENITFSDKAFVSTSLDREVAKGFGKNIFEIVLLPGQKAFDVASLGLEKANEKEVLLPRNMKFRVTAFEKISKTERVIRAVAVLE
jgi:2'-5' RNA ligase